MAYSIILNGGMFSLKKINHITDKLLVRMCTCKKGNMKTRLSFINAKVKATWTKIEEDEDDI